MNHHEFSGLRNTQISSILVLKVQSQSQFHLTKNQDVGRCAFLPEIQGKNLISCLFLLLEVIAFLDLWPLSSFSNKKFSIMK